MERERRRKRERGVEGGERGERVASTHSTAISFSPFSLPESVHRGGRGWRERESHPHIRYCNLTESQSGSEPEERTGEG
eukprot:1762878-Rhodomonas_salina.1